MKVDPWSLLSEFANRECDQQENAAKQQRIDQPGIEPVEAVTLVQGGIEQAETQTRVDYSPPIRGLEHRLVDRLARYAEMDADQHERRQQRRIPKDPFP